MIMTKLRSRIFKNIAIVLIAAMVVQLVLPIDLLALTNGPHAPEFSKFVPVSTAEMVNRFTGDFTYNLPILEVPGPSGSGYAMSVSYQSGASPEEEASWVGYGWTLNPGAINRNKRGFPDDYNGSQVEYWNKMPANQTIAITPSTDLGELEVFSSNPFESIAPSVDYDVILYLTMRYNNYKGFSLIAGANLGIDMVGMASLSFGANTTGQVDYSVGFTGHKWIPSGSFSASLNAGSILTNRNGGFLPGIMMDSPLIRGGLGGLPNIRGSSSIAAMGNAYVMNLLSDDVRATNVVPYIGGSHNFSTTVQGNSTLFPVGFEVGLDVNYTWQKNKEVDTLNAFGYMYSANAEDEDMMDYYVEKESPYVKRDKYLSIPFSSPDNFIVTGEGISGSFRLYNKKPGYFHPNAVESGMLITQLGGEVMLGVNSGIGADVGVGITYLKVEDWSASQVYTPGASALLTDRSFAGTEEGDEPYLFRFSNDLGGHINMSNEITPYPPDWFIDTGEDYGTLTPIDGGEPDDRVLNNNPDPQIADLAAQALLGGGDDPIGLQRYVPIVTENIKYIANDSTRIQRSSYIAYHTNEEMAASINGKSYKAYTNDPSTKRWVNRGEAALKDGIGEFTVFNKAGFKYTYGLPVYSRNEMNMQYGLAPLYKEGAVTETDIKNNYLVYVNRTLTPEDAEQAVGEVRKTPYAATHLLTEITTPDYIDRTMDGPTADDFGGWTKFNYEQLYGSNANQAKMGNAGNWYRWRMPYNGLLFHKNEVANTRDDMGSFASGEREVYYLSSIETKTHIAKFRTKWRADGIGAAWPAEAVRENARGNPRLKKLDKIELYAKDKNGEASRLIRTVHFRYDYSLMRGQPNSLNDEGKLTLKRVWFEYENIKNDGISPYEFIYQYPRTSSIDRVNYPSEYDALENYGNYSASAQNPDYNIFNLDMWGNYQPNGRARHERLNPWVDQNPDMSQFDPAAWQLKRIKLPTGGEIHIQYEQDEYAHVQDRDALAMVSLKPITAGDPSIFDVNNFKYYLNVNDLGIGENNSEDLEALKDLINDKFIENDEKIYFKFLYALMGRSATGSPPGPNNCNSDFIDGYASLHEVGIDENGLFVFLYSGNGMGITDGGTINWLTDVEAYTLPRQVCLDYLQKTKIGFLQGLGNCMDTDLSFEISDPQNTPPEAIIMSAVDQWENAMATIAEFVDNNTNFCMEIDYANSYFRIPLLKAKKGGGIHVKRLLTYDKGLEKDDAVLYGSEYIYETADGKSSGVAGNEPKIAREENALVTYLEKRNASTVLTDEQIENLIGDLPAGVSAQEAEEYVKKTLHTFTRVISGDDKEQFEGPLGESILPMASVGYSRVVVKNIHSGKTQTGYIVNEFYTAKDYPFDGPSQQGYYDGNAVDFTDIQREQDYLPFFPPLIPFTSVINKIWLTQGYRFIRNNMHGQRRRIATYASLDAGAPISSQEYRYFEPGEKVPMVYGLNEIKYEHPGKEMEVIFESRQIIDAVADGNIEGDYSAGMLLFVPVPFISAGAEAHIDYKALATHVTTKIISYPAIVDSIISYLDGVQRITEFIGFDPGSGEPVLTRTTDEFHGLTLQQSQGEHNGAYNNYTLPAHQEYPAMGTKARNERAVLKD